MASSVSYVTALNPRRLSLFGAGQSNPARASFSSGEYLHFGAPGDWSELSERKGPSRRVQIMKFVQAGLQTGGSEATVGSCDMGLVNRRPSQRHITQSPITTDRAAWGDNFGSNSKSKQSAKVRVSEENARSGVSKAA